jgi:hypothetical protein
VFLARSHPATYASMEKNGGLEPYLQTVGEQAANAYEVMEDQMIATAKQIEDPVAQARYRNTIPLTVEEIIDADFVFAPLS